MRHTIAAIAFLAVVSFLLYSCLPGTQAASVEKVIVPPHPLDPLDTAEISTVKKILLSENKIDTTYRFYIINLYEPPKSEMLVFRSGDNFQRLAFASVFDWATNKTYEAIVDLKASKTISFKNIPGVTPGMMAKDSIADQILKTDAAWMAGLQKRNIHPDSVTVSGVFAGDMGIAPPDHRELICMPQYKNKKYEHLYVDGLVAYVDLTASKVLKVIDDGGKGYYKPEDISYFDMDSAENLLPPTNPLNISHPEGTGVKVEGFQIASSKWKMRAGIHNREGLVIYEASYNDNGIWRPVLYRASMAEMYVPYGSIDLGHTAWNYYDGGAYRLGQMFTKKMYKLSQGADVPPNAQYLPGFFHDEKGKPLQIDSAVAVFEEYGGPLTRHGNFAVEARNVAVKYFVRIGNYDYGFKWIFREDGQIDVKTELTGIVGIKGVNRVTDAPGQNDDTYNGSYFGTLVAPHVEAVNHQHFFSFRIDMDVDGTENLVEEMNTNPLPAGKANPWGNAFIMQMSIMKNESEAQRSTNNATNRHWMIANANATNSLGQQKSYVLMPGHNASPIALPGSAPRRMADFLENSFWATAYKENEVFPAGDYPNSRGIKDGLPLWTSNNESIEKKDVVIWYNMGITHIVRPEDWPVMNVHTMGFSLIPFGFFDSNPVARNKKATKKQPTLTAGPTPPDVTICVPLPKEKTKG